jgi:hypothetical protein
MNLYAIDEPELQFADGRHVCPMAGISSRGVYDADQDYGRDSIRIGGVGTPEDLQYLNEWLSRCEQGIEAPAKPQPLLFPPFPGFTRHTGFRTKLVYEEGLTRSIPDMKIEEAVAAPSHNRRIEKLVSLYLEKIEHLAEHRPVDVIVCITPDFLEDVLIDKESDSDTSTSESSEASFSGEEETVPPEGGEERRHNFRRVLKAKAIHLRKPLQLTWASSLTEKPAGKQNDATRAWNFMTALYYKAGPSIPWKLVEHPDRPKACFVGLGFYESLDEEQLRTSMAQIFDEMGRSVILRGTPIPEREDKDDRRPYLSGEQAHSLLLRALDAYEGALEHLPVRIVIHKTSAYRDQEIEGLTEAMHEKGIYRADFVNIQPSAIRLYRDGKYPPYRGTALELSADRHLLYTRGSVEYYGTYPGQYVPQPIEIRRGRGDTSTHQLTEEVLALTKMNWNNTRFDGKMPITIECARKVGEIMRHVDESVTPDVSYRYYM